MIQVVQTHLTGEKAEVKSICRNICKNQRGWKINHSMPSGMCLGADRNTDYASI